MVFDIRTLIVAVALANVFCAGARFLLWRMNPGIPGLGRWALAGVAGALALFLILLFGIKHWQPSLSLAQLCVVFGLLMAWDGFRRFIKRRPLSPLVLITVTASALIWITTVHFQYPMQARAQANAILIVILSTLIARELFTAPKPIRLAMRATAWVYIINAAVFLLRLIATDQNALPADSLNPDGFTVFMLLWWLCMTIAITLGMVLMTAEYLQADLDSLANHDPLTGALNRRSFSLLAEKEIARSRRYSKPLSLLMMDLDKFKNINDRLGHDAGDALLCQFVTIAIRELRDEDVFCRFGGEEFIALLPNASAEQALIVTERLRASFAAESPETKIRDDIHFPSVTVSIGVAELGEGDDIESLLCRADTALYQAKRKGRNRCELAEHIPEITMPNNKEYVKNLVD